MDPSIETTIGIDAESTASPLVAERYRLESTLGVGGMGTVHLATDTQTDDYVAIKTLRADLASDILVRSRLQREAFIGARIRSRHVAQLLDHGEDPKYGPYIVFEYLEGEPLSSLIERRGSLTVQEAVEITIDVLRGLEAFHRVGLAHRDVKPENVFLVEEKGLRGTSRLGARLIDFGLSRAIVAGHDGTERVTMEGIVAGTPEYMAPEQISDAPDQDARVDLYATGVMLYQMLAGRLPFCGTKPEAIFEQVLHEPPQPLEQACPGIDPDLADKVHRAMSRLPLHRYPTASAMRLVLDDWMKRYYAGRARVQPGEPTARMPALREPRVAPPAPQRRALGPSTIIAASACLTLVTMLAIARMQRPAAPRTSIVLDARVSPSPLLARSPSPAAPTHHVGPAHLSARIVSVGASAPAAGPSGAPTTRVAPRYWRVHRRPPRFTAVPLARDVLASDSHSSALGGVPNNPY